MLKIVLLVKVVVDQSYVPNSRKSGNKESGTSPSSAAALISITASVVERCPSQIFQETIILLFQFVVFLNEHQTLGEAALLVQILLKQKINASQATAQLLNLQAFLGSGG